MTSSERILWRALALIFVSTVACVVWVTSTTGAGPARGFLTDRPAVHTRQFELPSREDRLGAIEARLLALEAHCSPRRKQDLPDGQVLTLARDQVRDQRHYAGAN